MSVYFAQYIYISMCLYLWMYCLLSGQARINYSSETCVAWFMWSVRSRLIWISQIINVLSMILLFFFQICAQHSIYWIGIGMDASRQMSCSLCWRIWALMCAMKSYMISYARQAIQVSEWVCHLCTGVQHAQWAINTSGTRRRGAENKQATWVFSCS